MDQEELTIPDGWQILSYVEPGADTGKTEKNVELITPGPQTGEDDYHSKYVDPEGPFGAAKVTGAEDSYGGKGGEAQETPEGELPKVPQDWGLQAPRYPARHKGVASSY